ncbi:hypothetical protein NQZ68_009886 [Dissostichus eleginoides]|nr:hypothetical protein NQZ68_009886 [Dissostichus eleginoides]
MSQWRWVERPGSCTAASGIRECSQDSVMIITQQSPIVPGKSKRKIEEMERVATDGKAGKSIRAVAKDRTIDRFCETTEFQRGGVSPYNTADFDNDVNASVSETNIRGNVMRPRGSEALLHVVR